jgi:hypothetical protein
MNNEPVAWMFQGAFDISTYVSFEKPNPDIYPNPTPLYTHPAKTLTDEEIEEVWIQALQDEPKVNAGNFPSLANQPFVFFARAILRKAQEK